MVAPLKTDHDATQVSLRPDGDPVQRGPGRWRLPPLALTIPKVRKLYVEALKTTEEHRNRRLLAPGGGGPWQASAVRRALNNRLRTGTDKGNLTV